MDILDEVLDSSEVENEGWKIKNDEQADWWIEVKEAELVEIRRLKMQLENKIAFYKEKLDKVEKEEKQIIEQRDGRLAEYFETLDESQMKKTKTMHKYRLPSGELVKKFPEPEFKRNNDTLAKWLEDNQLDEYVEIKKQAKWGELKKGIEVVGNSVVLKDTGEIVEGVEAIERAPEFQVKI